MATELFFGFKIKKHQNASFLSVRVPEGNLTTKKNGRLMGNNCGSVKPQLTKPLS